MSKTDNTLSMGRRGARVALSALMALCCVPAQAFAFDDGTADTTVEAAEAADVATDAEIAASEALTELEIEAAVAAAPTLADQGASASALATAETYTKNCGNGWFITFSVTGDVATVSSVSVVGSGKLTLPATIAGATVTAIGNAAFKGVTGLTEIEIPEGVETIGAEAFRNTGLTSIALPSTVVSADKSAFRDNASLKSATLNEGLTTVGSYLFKSDTALESIVIPSTMNRVPYEGFRDCTALASVSFAGDTIRYLHAGAFRNCSSLTSIELPLLVGTATAEEANAEGLTNVFSYIKGYTIGYNCFQDCSNLKTIVLGGPVVSEPKSYFSSSSCLTGCASGLQIVNKGARAQVSYGTATSRSYVSDEYCTLDYYYSMEDAEAYTNKVASITCKTQIIEIDQYEQATSTIRPAQLIPLVTGSKDYSEYLYADSDTEVPALPEGKVWCILDSPESSYSSGNMGNSSFNYYNDKLPFTSSYQVVAVDKGCLSSAWIDNDTIRAYYSDDTGTSSAGIPTLTLEEGMKSTDLDTLAVRQTDGNVIDSSLYTLRFQKATMERTRGFGGYYYDTVKSWDDIDRADMVESGWYRVTAIGVGEYSNTSTAYTYFKLESPVPETKSYYSAESASTYLNTLTDNASRYMYDDSSYSVVVSGTDWQAQLVGAGLAGADGNSDNDFGAGLLLLDFGAGEYTGMTTGHIISKATMYLLLGSEKSVPMSAADSEQTYLADYISAKCVDGGWRAGADAETSQELATSVVSEFRPANWGAEWGSTALVASSTMELVGSAAMGYAYANGCRVLYLDEDGAISDTDLALLSDSSVENIVLVGDEGDVSSTVATQIASATGKTPTRILDGVSVGASSLELAKQTIAAKVADDSSYKARIIIADASDSANCAAAAMFANVLDGVMVSVDSTADAKALRAYLEDLISTSKLGLRAVDYLYTVGEFSFIEGDADDYFQQPWTGSTAVVRSLELGDTFEVEGYMYKLVDRYGVVSAEFIDATPGVDSEDVPDEVTFDGTTYPVVGEVDFFAYASTTPVSLGQTAVLTCTVDGIEEGEGAGGEGDGEGDDEGEEGITLAYQWQWRKVGGAWANATANDSAKTAVFSVPATSARAKYEWRCVVTASDGRTAATDAIMFDIAAAAELTATASTSPVALGATGKLTCAVEGLGSATAAYQWQYRTSSTGSWKNATATGNKTATMSAAVTASRAANEYRCVVTASDGRTATTDVIKFDVEAAAALTATASTDAVSAIGATGKLTCAVEGLGSATASYQWMYRTSSTGAWKNATATGAKTATLSATVTSSRLANDYKCVVTASDGRTAETAAIKFEVAEAAALTATASTKAISAIGDKGTLSCAVEGLGSATATYQWQYRASSTAAWANATANASAKTADFTVPVNASRAANEWRCVVTASDGRTTTTDVIMFQVGASVTATASTTPVAMGATAKLTCAVSGNTGTPAYQWQYRTSSTGSWKAATATGNKTATLSAALTATRLSYDYRCQVTVDGQTVYTDAIKFQQS